MLAIHGGAGNFGLTDAGAERIEACKRVLREAMEAGLAQRDRDGSALDMVEAAVLVMEESELFNAGRGSVFTHDEGHELDASIMSSERRQAGAVAGVGRIKNPIRAARRVLEESEHVLLAGAGAEAFAAAQGLEMVENRYFSTEERRQQLRRAIESESTVLDHEGESDDKFGTVGAVARDSQGRLAAATSTGGMTNKRYGRVGDSPIIGAGCFADEHVAVSCTGHGEFFIRYAVAHELSARMRLAGMTLRDASRQILDELAAVGGSGGLIAVDARGALVTPMNTTGMYRGWVDAGGRIQVAALATD